MLCKAWLSAISGVKTSHDKSFKNVIWKLIKNTTVNISKMHVWPSCCTPGEITVLPRLPSWIKGATLQ